MADEKLEEETQENSENLEQNEETTEDENSSEENSVEQEETTEEEKAVEQEPEEAEASEEEKPVEQEPEEAEASEEEKPVEQEPEEAEAGEEETAEPDLKDKALDKAKEVLPKILSVARKFFSIKVTHVLYALGALVFCLFLFLLLDLKEVQETQKLIGYIKIHHKVPEWFHGEELPAEAHEHLENYRAKQEKIRQSYIVIPEDRNANNKVLGSLDDKPLTNEKLMKILKAQDLGRVTQSGVEKPENMRLSGYDFTQLSYKYFREFVGADKLG